LKSSWKQSDFKFSGKEFNSQTGLNDFGWRRQDPIIGRMWGIDRFSEKYYGLSPMQFAGNNPISNIEVNGDSLMLFKNGVYVSIVDNGKKEITGFNQESSTGKDGKETFTGGQSFNFNDYADDMAGIKSGELKLRFVGNDEISEMMVRSGVLEQGNRDNATTYIERESRPKNRESVLSGKSKGKMDYQNYTNEYPKYGSLNIVEGIAYNNADYGNFLWGQGGKQLGFSYGTLRTASHINNAFNSGTDNPDKPYNVLDSPGDQRAIRNGYNYWMRKPKGLHR
jgi:RHS repeat-associated protein